MIGSISFRPDFAKNLIDSSFREAHDGELEHAPTQREQRYLGYDQTLENPLPPQRAHRYSRS